MQTKEEAQLMLFQIELNSFLKKPNHQRQIIYCFKDPKKWVGSRAPALSKSAKLLLSIQNNDIKYLSLFECLIKSVVSRIFPKKTQNTILEVLIHQDKYLLDGIIKSLTEEQLKQLNLLSAYTSLFHLNSAKKISDEKEAFLSEDGISSPFTIKETIDALMEKYKSAEGKKSYIYSAVTTPFFFYHVTSHFISDEQHIRRIVSESDLSSYAELNKAIQVPILAETFQAIHGKSIKIPRLLYQIAAIYPITDDYLDSEDYNYEEKLTLCHTIRDYIKSVLNTGTNPIKEYSKKLPAELIRIFSEIELDNPSLDYSRIWQALLELNRLQRLSMMQQSNLFNKKNITQDLFEICYEKGALTFELIVLIAIPDITDQQLTLIQRLGGLYQLLDDREDLLEDAGNDILTYSSDYILAPDPNNHCNTVYDRCRSTQFSDRTSRLIRNNTFMSMLHHRIDEVMTQMRKGHCHFSNLILNKMHIDLLEQISGHVADLSEIKREKMSP